ncbi:hypothetical protein NADFUDRAFT_41726 [Nadsonia fulvescens var. elongata DSM 6958]|uniref:Uncharacterized protein n=1 Tax=Nadsonia fulvescens var. elongata DSM 6958 TaxID=857566 RepID=A0A1E3PKK9_9ASCO|nr:hypothetical protein NADFUDRAFT_41726 [Nadsonia fulvescens var. elongata DSM 6958]
MDTYPSAFHHTSDVVTDVPARPPLYQDDLAKSMRALHHLSLDIPLLPPSSPFSQEAALNDHIQSQHRQEYQQLQLQHQLEIQQLQQHQHQLEIQQLQQHQLHAQQQKQLLHHYQHQYHQSEQLPPPDPIPVSTPSATTSLSSDYFSSTTADVQPSSRCFSPLHEFPIKEEVEEEERAALEDLRRELVKKQLLIHQLMDVITPPVISTPLVAPIPLENSRNELKIATLTARDFSSNPPSLTSTSVSQLPQPPTSIINKTPNVQPATDIPPIFHTVKNSEIENIDETRNLLPPLPENPIISATNVALAVTSANYNPSSLTSPVAYSNPQSSPTKIDSLSSTLYNTNLGLSPKFPVQKVPTSSLLTENNGGNDYNDNDYNNDSNDNNDNNDNKEDVCISTPVSQSFLHSIDHNFHPSTDNESTNPLGENLIQTPPLTPKSFSSARKRPGVATTISAPLIGSNSPSSTAQTSIPNNFNRNFSAPILSKFDPDLPSVMTINPRRMTHASLTTDYESDESSVDLDPAAFGDSTVTGSSEPFPLQQSKTTKERKRLKIKKRHLHIPLAAMGLDNVLLQNSYSINNSNNLNNINGSNIGFVNTMLNYHSDNNHPNSHPNSNNDFYDTMLTSDGEFYDSSHGNSGSSSATATTPLSSTSNLFKKIRSNIKRRVSRASSLSAHEARENYLNSENSSASNAGGGSHRNSLSSSINPLTTVSTTISSISAPTATGSGLSTMSNTNPISTVTILKPLSSPSMTTASLTAVTSSPQASNVDDSGSILTSPSVFDLSSTSSGSGSGLGSVSSSTANVLGSSSNLSNSATERLRYNNNTNHANNTGTINNNINPNHNNGSTVNFVENALYGYGYVDTLATGSNINADDGDGLGDDEQELSDYFDRAMMVIDAVKRRKSKKETKVLIEKPEGTSNELVDCPDIFKSNHNRQHHHHNRHHNHNSNTNNNNNNNNNSNNNNHVGVSSLVSSLPEVTDLSNNNSGTDLLYSRALSASSIPSEDFGDVGQDFNYDEYASINPSASTIVLHKLTIPTVENTRNLSIKELVTQMKECERLVEMTREKMEQSGWYNSESIEKWVTEGRVVKMSWVSVIEARSMSESRS